MNNAFEFVRQFGFGINLGNSLDAPDDETAWGNPRISRKLIQFYRKEGFQTIRVPVTWHKHLDAYGYVNPFFMDRVREVIGWCLGEGFITVLNLHHDGNKDVEGWLTPAFDESALQRFARLWTQIAERFSNCGERLVFEAFNEIRNGDDWQGTDVAFDAVNRLAAKFVETIRASGGNNVNRYLMIPTYAASDGEQACQGWKRIGNDERVIATVHCYDPHEFTHQSAGKKEYDSNWCKPALEAVFERLKRIFIDQGIPVVIGEANVIQKSGIPAESGRIAWAHDIAQLSSKNGIPLIVWEDGGWMQLVDRAKVCWTHPDLARAYVNPFKKENYTVEIKRATLAKFRANYDYLKKLISFRSKSSYLWHDEFDGVSIDSSKWSFEIGTGNNGWGNNEKEYYTDRPENAYVKDGILHIRAVRESYKESDYTSARMITKGKFSFTYGMVEARIALPTGKGIWPAFWMLGENIDSVGWPACGEIDIIEAINDENVVYGTNHWNYEGNHAQYGHNTKDFYGAKRDLDITQFHIYKMVWNKDVISMYVDDFKYHDISIKDNAGGTDSFHKPFFLILNVAVGGKWPGFEIDDSQFPNEMLVDYIRVSQLT